MGLLDLASAASIWRGYDYYMDKKILAFEQVGESEYVGLSMGSGDVSYAIKIDIAHPRKSSCNCPHANGKRIICKHQVALYFTIFPDEAQRFYQASLDYVREEEKRQDELEEKVMRYINSLSKDELRQILLEVLYDGEQRVFDRFVREHIEW